MLYPKEKSDKTNWNYLQTNNLRVCQPIRFSPFVNLVLTSEKWNKFARSLSNQGGSDKPLDNPLTASYTTPSLEKPMWRKTQHRRMLKPLFVKFMRQFTCYDCGGRYNLRFYPVYRAKDPKNPIYLISRTGFPQLRTEIPKHQIICGECYRQHYAGNPLDVTPLNNYYIDYTQIDEGLKRLRWVDNR